MLVFIYSNGGPLTKNPKATGNSFGCGCESFANKGLIIHLGDRMRAAM